MKCYYLLLRLAFTLLFDLSSENLDFLLKFLSFKGEMFDSFYSLKLLSSDFFIYDKFDKDGNPWNCVN